MLRLSIQIKEALYYLGFGDLSSGKSSDERVLSLEWLFLTRLLSYRAAYGARQLDGRPQLHPALGAPRSAISNDGRIRRWMRSSRSFHRWWGLGAGRNREGQSGVGRASSAHRCVGWGGLQVSELDVLRWTSSEEIRVCRSGRHYIEWEKTEEHAVYEHEDMKSGVSVARRWSYKSNNM